MGLATGLLEKWINGKLSFFINVRFILLTLTGILLLITMAAVGFRSVFSKRISEPPGEKQSSVSTNALIIVFFLPIFCALAGLSTPVIITMFLFVMVAGLSRLSAISKDAFTKSNQYLSTSIPSLAVILIPVILLTFVPVKPLSSSSLTNRVVSFSAPASVSSKSTTNIQNTPTERSILDWVKLFNHESDPSSYISEPVHVIGFVFHEDRLSEGQFMVGRFAITCCVADAFVIGMVVDWPQAASLADDTWIEIEGTIDMTTFNDEKVPLIHASSITPVDIPEQPYLYP